eukprot:301752-Chlamydomonas_euryale.AAC.1
MIRMVPGSYSPTPSPGATTTFMIPHSYPPPWRDHNLHGPSFILLPPTPKARTQHPWSLVHTPSPHSPGANTTSMVPRS